MSHATGFCFWSKGCGTFSHASGFLYSGPPGCFRLSQVRCLGLIWLWIAHIAEFSPDFFLWPHCLNFRSGDLFRFRPWAVLHAPCPELISDWRPSCHSGFLGVPHVFLRLIKYLQLGVSFSVLVVSYPSPLPRFPFPPHCDSASSSAEDPSLTC